MAHRRTYKSLSCYAKLIFSFVSNWHRRRLEVEATISGANESARSRQAANLPLRTFVGLQRCGSCRPEPAVIRSALLETGQVAVVVVVRELGAGLMALRTRVWMAAPNTVSGRKRCSLR